MQFVRHGPDIPERLLQLHEDGRVVFFCGAGISYPARLPGFSGLVSKLYQTLSVIPNPVQQSAIKSGQFDTAIGLLEADYVGGREAVRRALATILIPDLSAPKATATHEALLTLAQDRAGHTRLITTNFDRLFEEVRTSKSLSFPDYRAPLLRVPKSNWDGLVYLHGLLPATPTVPELERLVVSSGDFGLAYLTERWAARFVSELFSRFTVCFVGYSISDPVLRYMMDALAADRQRGESLPEVFAFGSHSKGKEVARTNEWKVKNVTPILYREHDHHTYLHKTLRAWAATYRDGVRGKERIVVECAIARPLATTKQDDYVGRMLWALSDPCGLPAKRFAELDPVPSLDWLEPLSQAFYRHADLRRFGVPPRAEVDEKLSFSFIDRPTPYIRAPRMVLVDSGPGSSGWDDVMVHLASWLTRHLDNPALLIWIAKRGGQLHHYLAQLVSDSLQKLDAIEKEGNVIELARIRASAPDAIPRPLMRSLWRLLLTGRVRSNSHDFELYQWRRQFKRDGLTASLRLSLRQALSPCVLLSAPLHLSSDEEDATRSERLKDLVDWEIVLASRHVHSTLREHVIDEHWTEALPELLDDFSALLRDVLDLRRELGDVDDRSDNSYVDQPSIGAHPQNRAFHDWTSLVELTRDAWLATAMNAPIRARLTAERWAMTPYPLFRRLALFAAAQSGVVSTRMALDWLLGDGHLWLWTSQTKREAIRLLVALAPRLDSSMLGELEQAILKGPPTDLYSQDIEPEHLAEIAGREVWLRLAKLAHAGATLATSTSERLNSLAAAHPTWSLAPDQRDEFPFWMSGSWEGDSEPWSPTTSLPRRRSELLKYLRAHPDLVGSEQDDWSQLCKESFQTTAYALYALSLEGSWPADRWRQAINAWSEENLRERAWRYMGPVLNGAPDAILETVAHSVSWWLRAIAKTFQGHELLFVNLSRRILSFGYTEDTDTDDAITRAINHPVGHATEALLYWWYRQALEDNQQLPQVLREVFGELCDTTVAKFRHGRILLAANVVALFRVDRKWSEEYLLPLFDWQRSESEARIAWKGFLWTPRLHRPLLESLGRIFLETATHYAALGKHASQYASVLTYAALDAGESFTSAKLADAFRALPSEGLHDAAHALVRALESSGDQREEYWRNRIYPFWQKVWPKSAARRTDNIGEALAQLAVAAGNEFPEAVRAVDGWLRRLDNPSHVVHLLNTSGLASRFPEVALHLLDAIISDGQRWIGADLRGCLLAVAGAAAQLTQDQRYMRLDAIARQSGS